MKTAAFLVSGELPQLTTLSILWSHHHVCRVYRWSRKESEVWVCQFKNRS